MRITVPGVLGRRANQRRRLVLKCADIATGGLRARKAALIDRQGVAIGVAARAGAKSRTAWEERDRQSGTAIVLQRTEFGIDGALDLANLVAIHSVHEPTGAVAVQIMAERLE